MQKKALLGKALTTFFTLSLAMVLLTGCSLFGGSTAQATPTPAPQPTMPNLQMTTYQGDSFSINYPQSAQKQAITKDIVVFTDAQTGAIFEVVAIPNPSAAISPDVLAKSYLDSVNKNLDNPQPVNAPATKTVAGVQWKQSVNTAQKSGQNIKEVSLTTNHPDKDPQTKAFVIYYLAPAQAMDQLDQFVFEPMLQSFKFAA